VFDGHGGREAAEVLENSFPKALWTEMEAGQCLEAGGDAPGKLEAALERTFYRLDERVLEHSRREGWRAGSTAVVCLLQGQDLLVANVGDSEAVLGELPDADEPSLEATESEGEPEPEPKPEQTDDNKTSGSGDERLCGGREEKQENGEPERARARARARQARREQRQWAHRECRVTARLLTEKHSPTVPEERLRIERAGGRVMLGRVNGSLAVSRAFGDMEFKQSGPRGGTETLVIVRPAIRRVRLDPRHRVLVLACDGLWEKVSYERAVRVAQEERVCGRSAQEAAHALVKLALDEGSLDNITVLVVFFDWNDSPAGSASFQAPAAAASASASGHPAASAPTHMIE
jgi:serine/threonine protein phosphatase PrpC